MKRAKLKKIFPEEMEKIFSEILLSKTKPITVGITNLQTEAIFYKL